LALALANAYRRGDSAEIVAMHHFVARPNASVAEQRATAKRDWRRLVQQYQLSGYRVSMLTLSDRRIEHHGLQPVRRLVINLMERHGMARRSINRIISSVAGSYYLVSR